MYTIFVHNTHWVHVSLSDPIWNIAGHLSQAGIWVDWKFGGPVAKWAQEPAKSWYMSPLMPWTKKPIWFLPSIRQDFFVPMSSYPWIHTKMQEKAVASSARIFMATVTRELQDNASKTSLGMVEPIYVEQGSNHLKWGIIFLCELTHIVLFTLVGPSDSSFHTMTWP